MNTYSTSNENTCGVQPLSYCEMQEIDGGLIIMAGHSICADTSSSNVVFLLVQETSCSSCLSEVRWWEENQQNFEDTKIYILVTSKYQSVGKSFIEREGITIYPIFDTTNDLRAKDLVPTLPVKLFINREGKIQKIHAIDSGKKLDIFIEALSK